MLSAALPKETATIHALCWQKELFLEHCSCTYVCTIDSWPMFEFDILAFLHLLPASYLAGVVVAV
jgi:hypothetical protein